MQRLHVRDAVGPLKNGFYIIANDYDVAVAAQFKRLPSAKSMFAGIGSDVIQRTGSVCMFQVNGMRFLGTGFDLILLLGVSRDEIQIRR